MATHHKRDGRCSQAGCVETARNVQVRKISLWQLIEREMFAAHNFFKAGGAYIAQFFINRKKPSETPG